MRLLRSLSNAAIVLTVLTAGGAGFWYFQDQISTRRQIAKLQEQNRVLTQVVQRLGDERRVAQLLVTDQKMVDGAMQTTLLFVEDDRAGHALPPRTLTIRGNVGHLDAMVIKFDRHFVSEADPLRGKSIALFTRIYGDEQSPAAGAMIDSPGKAPEIYRGAESRVSEFEQTLWKDFWRLADDESYRAKFGVRVANGQGVWRPFEKDTLYTVTLESSGGLNIASEPVKEIYREALKRSASQSNLASGN